MFFFHFGIVCGDAESFYIAERHKVYTFCRTEEQSSAHPLAAKSSQTLRPGGWMCRGCGGVWRAGECDIITKNIAIHVVGYFKYLELFVFISFLGLHNCMYTSLPNKRLTWVV